MAYHPVELPPGTLAETKRYVREHVDPYLADVHAMLRLPQAQIPGLEAGCNVSAAKILFDVISGVSVELLRPAPVKDEEYGDRFRRLLERYFPWGPPQAGAITGLHAAKILYDAFRNPLTHSLGVDGIQKHGQRKLAKGALPEEEIGRIERARCRPAEWEVPTLFTDSDNKADRTKTVLTVKCFYWGVRRMIFNLAKAQHAGSQVPGAGIQADKDMPIGVTGTGTPTYRTVGLSDVSSVAPRPERDD